MKNKPVKATIAALSLTAALMLSGQALAHKVIASAFAEGDKIEGEIGFSNGDMAPNQLVEIFAEDGRKLGEATTDEEGFFIFAPTEKIIHIFRADLGAGHVAEYRMELDELPETLAAAGTSTMMTAASAASNNETATLSAAASPAGLDKMIADAVRREVKPLRREIAAYKEKNDLQTIMGGIGYIIGLFGIAFYVAANRKLKQLKEGASE